MGWEGGQFSKQEGGRNPHFIFHQLPPLNDNDHTHTHTTHTKKKIREKDRPTCLHYTPTHTHKNNMRDTSAVLLRGKGQQRRLYGLFCFCCVCHCHLFPVYVLRAAPACRAASPHYYVYSVYYVCGLAAPLNLSAGAEFGFTVSVLVMMSGVSK